MYWFAGLFAATGGVFAEFLFPPGKYLIGRRLWELEMRNIVNLNVKLLILQVSLRKVIAYYNLIFKMKKKKF